MVKVFFTNGDEATFAGDDFTHNAEHKMFFIQTPGNKRVMIPDYAVSCIGIWDEEKQSFV